MSLSSDFETGFAKAFCEIARDCFEENTEKVEVNENRASQNIALRYVQTCFLVVMFTLRELF